MIIKIVNPGKLLVDILPSGTKIFTDQFNNNKIVRISLRHLSNYLRRTYNILQQEYFEIINSGVDEIEMPELPLPDSKWSTLDKSSLKVRVSPGKILFKYGYYLDQLRDDNKRIKDTHFQRYLKSIYDITIDEYYNIVMFNDINYIKKCANPTCNSIIKVYKLSYGANKCCCKGCASKLTMIGLHQKYGEHMVHNMIHLHDDPEYRKLKSKIFSDVMKKVHANDHESHVKIVNAGNMQRAITKHKYYQSMYFYLAISSDNKIKIGVSGQINRRCSQMNYKTIHTIFNTDVETAFKIEEEIKTTMLTTGEYFDFNYLHDIVLLLKKIKLSLNSND